MATQDFAASWVDVYNRVGGWSKKHSSHPIRTGNGSGTNWQTFIRIPEAVKQAANSSTTTPTLHMRIYFTTAANEIDIGHHRTSSARSVGASGIPWYAYNETWRSIGTGWREYQMSNWFLPNFLSGNVQGIVLYSYQGQFTNVATGLGQSNHVRFRVTGTWNTPPTTPTNARVDKSVADISQTFRFNASTDAEQSQSQLRYDVEFYNGSSWSRVSTRQSGLTYTRNTTNNSQTTNARFRVRAYDGELYSGWGYSPHFEIRHVAPSFSSSSISYIDRNSTTVGISGNSQHIIQNASLPRASVNSAASGNDGKTISRYIFTLGGQERTRSSLGTVDFNALDASYNQTLRVTAEDSAGLRTTVTRTVTMIAYQQPQLQYTVQRLGNLSDTTLMTLSGSISSLSGENTLQTTRYRYRVEGGSYGSWFTFNRSISGSSFTTTDVTLQLDNTTGWEIEIQVSDRLTTRTVVATVRSGRPITFADIDKNSFGVGKFPENDNSFEVDTDAIFESGLNVKDSNLIVSASGNNFRFESDGSSFMSWLNKNGTRRGYFGISSSSGKDIVLHNEMDGNIHALGERLMFNSNDVIATGSNSNGNWIRFYNGTQICWQTINAGFPTERSWGNLFRSWEIRATLPVGFVNSSETVFSMQVIRTNNDSGMRLCTTGQRPFSTATPNMYMVSPATSSDTAYEITYIAVGRWNN